MPYNSPFDSLSRDRTGRLLLKANILICLHPHSPVLVLFLCSSVNVMIFLLDRGEGGGNIVIAPHSARKCCSSYVM